MAKANNKQKTVLLGVSGCIAAYKACEIVRALQKAGVRVKVVMTKHATEFVGTATFRALIHESVAVSLFASPEEPIHHISLAEEADAFLIAPCTANVIAKVACGIADDLLTTTALACTAPLIIAPAMNTNMYKACATQENITRLKARGVSFIEPESGYLACGTTGKGRLASVNSIVSKTLEILNVPNNLRNTSMHANNEQAHHQNLQGKNVLITAGPTQEPIDPVRYLTNRSSGKMGYALATAAATRGANVTLISGPVNLKPPDGVNIIKVQTAAEMLNAANIAFASADIAIFTAAVADMRPKHPSSTKIKKHAGADLSKLELVENTDILATLAAKKTKQIVVGFAAETNNVVANAQKKLVAKNANLIIANQVGTGKTFGQDNVKATFIDAAGVKELAEMSKLDLAHFILDKANALNFETQQQQ